jgi:ferrous iron transport protein A
MTNQKIGGYMIPLCLADTGEPLIIKKIGGSTEVKQHLENLGFNAGSEIVIINTLGKNLIVKVKESRVAVSDELAKKIMV